MMAGQGSPSWDACPAPQGTPSPCGFRLSDRLTSLKASSPGFASSTVGCASVTLSAIVKTCVYAFLA